MTQLLNYLVSPGAGVLMSLAGLVWIASRPRSPRAWRMALLAPVAYMVAATDAVPTAVSRLWTTGLRRFEPSHTGAPVRPTAIVVLGAGGGRVSGSSDHIQMGPIETARVLEAWRVYGAIEADWIVSSGGPPGAPPAEPSSIVMRDALVGLGVPASRILLESSSLTTHDQAVLIGPMLRSHGVELIVLVTSTVHMPRSLGAFRAAGMNAVPAIAPDADSFRSWRGRYLPSIEGLGLSSRFAHEVVGLAYYRSRGWWRR